MLQKIERSEGHRRLARLAEELRTYTGSFDMNTWSCCAAGVAGRIPEFQKAGFTCSAAGPSFNGVVSGIDSLERFFDISWEDARDLFNGSRGPWHDPKAIAQRIDNLLDRLTIQAAFS